MVSFTKLSKRPVGVGTKFGEALMPAVDLAIFDLIREWNRFHTGATKSSTFSSYR